jgi:hypothetical protein
MAKTPIDRMLLNHLKTLPKFSGNQNEDAARWLQDITDGLNYAALTDDRKVSIIADYLNDDARRWLLENVSVLDSWPKFIQEFKKEFAPVLLKEVAVSQVNQCVYVSDKMMMFYDNDIKEEQKCELVEEKEVNLDYSSITLIELSNLVSLNTCIVESGEHNCETVWPDGCESWFIHDELPQRCQFIRSKQQEVLFNSTSNIDNNSAQENLSNCLNGISSSVVNDTYISASYNIEAFGNLLKLHAIYNDFISFFLFLGKLTPIINICRRIFIAATAGSYPCHNGMPCGTEDRDWFRYLAVP